MHYPDLLKTIIVTQLGLCTVTETTRARANVPVFNIGFTKEEK